PENVHILYNDANLTKNPDLSCETPDDGGTYSEEELQDNADNRANSLNCIKVYLEVDSDIRAQKGGVINAVWYVTGAFHQVATLYAAEGLNYQLSQVFVWASQGPYTNGSTTHLLNQFKARINTLNGNFGHLLTYRSSGGLAAGFNGLCNSNVDNSLCVSDIHASYNTVPTYSWTIMVMTHEMGHLNGSRHTHACVWNGNNTAIDGCAGFTEGGCPLPGIPSIGGTIMSYCHLTSAGINLSQGFGTQPGNVIRTAATNALCTCQGGPAGGSIPYYQVVAFQALVNKRYVAAENGGGTFLIANRTVAGPWERFQIIPAGGGYVALKALANNRYVAAEAAGNQDLIANRTSVGLWEKFAWINNSDGTVSLRAAVNNKYVVAEFFGSQPLIANRTSIGPWEKFYVHSHNWALPEGGSDKNFKAWPNPADHYLFLEGVAPGSQIEVLDVQGKVQLRSDEIEYVIIHNLAPGMYFLKVNGDMKYRFIKQ
ncbi:MAG TPA: T9SS type A sorting domain-containing protein, partial [Bacteroidetes bacterium]|nr:T9SS type A sorting domain-containing protein [Bacteroidota bacterium]